MRYAVDLTTRETFTVIVEADTAKEARRKARFTGEDVLEEFSHSDRTITGVKKIAKQDDDR